MSFKAINELRQAGKLDEALQMANQALEAAPDNIWNKRAVAWVYYSFLKKYAQPESFEAFKQNLVEIKNLQLPEDEKMLFDSCAWQIGILVFALKKTKTIDNGKINEIFEIIRDFHFTKPSEAYSYLFKAFHKGYQSWSNYLNFADWWHFDNFQTEDYIEEVFNDVKMLSIAEQAYIAYAKKLLEGTPLDAFGQKRLIDHEKIQSFLPKLDDFIEKHPKYQYPPYFKAKLLLAIGDNNNNLSVLLPFAKQKRRVFWMWQLLADIFPEDKALQFACYCKALCLNTPEGYLVQVRQTFAKMLIERGMYVEAKTEIQKVVDTRKAQNWGLPKQLTEWSAQSWYLSANAKKDNLDLYAKYTDQADELLFQDIPEELIAVEFVNQDKGILHFVKDKHRHGSFNYSNFISKPQIGDILKVRFHGAPQNGYFRAQTIKRAESHETCGAIKDFEGHIKIITPHNFAFVEDVFVDAKTVQANELENGQAINGKAIISYNKKKGQWGWKSILVNK
jgi:hypothetical protein